MKKNELNITRIMSNISKANEQITSTNYDLNLLKARLEKSSNAEHINELTNKIRENESIISAQGDIIEANKTLVNDFIASFEKRCTARTCDFDDINDFYRYLNKRHNRVKKASLIDCKYFYMPHAGRLPNAYKYTSSATATALYFEQRKTGLYLVNVTRENCNHAYDFRATYTDTAKQAIIDGLSNIL